MELFYGQADALGNVSLNAEESTHLVKVMRHKVGDEICVMDGAGTFMRCELTEANPKGCFARIKESIKGWHSHPYHLTMAVCPTKNNDRFEWMGEKVTEAGVDLIVPVIGERSERKVYKTDRLRRIALSAAKQSLKASIPEIEEPISVLKFIETAPEDSLRLIAYCSEGEKLSIKDALSQSKAHNISILIGPEGDFSPKEIAAALKAGFKPVHLGTSRLRTETAAVCAAFAVYLHYMNSDI